MAESKKYLEDELHNSHLEPVLDDDATLALETDAVEEENETIMPLYYTDPTKENPVDASDHTALPQVNQHITAKVMGANNSLQIPSKVSQASILHGSSDKHFFAEKSFPPSENLSTAGGIPSSVAIEVTLDQEPIPSESCEEDDKNNIFDVFLDKMVVTVPTLVKFITETEFNNDCIKCEAEKMSSTSSQNEDTSSDDGGLFRLMSLPGFVNFLLETKNTCPGNCSEDEAIKPSSSSTPNITIQEALQKPEHFFADTGSESESLEPAQILADEVYEKLGGEAEIVENKYEDRPATKEEQPLPITEETLKNVTLDEVNLYPEETLFEEGLVEKSLEPKRIEELPESIFDENHEFIFDEQPDLIFDGQPDFIFNDQPEFIFDVQPEFIFDDQPELIFDEQPELQSILEGQHEPIAEVISALPQNNTESTLEPKFAVDILELEPKPEPDD